MDVVLGVPAAGQVEVAAARCAAAYEDRVEALRHQRLQRIDPFATAEFDTQVEYVAGFFIDDGFGQAEARHLRAHETAGLGIAVVNGNLVSEWREVARNRQRRRTGTDASDATAVGFAGFWKPTADIRLVVGSDALQPADGDGFGFFAVVFLDPAASASGFARAVASSAEDAGEDIRFPVHQVGVVVTACGDEPDVVRNWRVGGACPLAIDDFVEVVGVSNIGGLH